MITHGGACRAAGVTFIPLVVESLGGWSEEAIQTIKSIGRLQGQRLGIPPPETTISFDRNVLNFVAIRPYIVTQCLPRPSSFFECLPPTYN